MSGLVLLLLLPAIALGMTMAGPSGVSPAGRPERAGSL